MINNLKNCQKSTLIGLLPDIINSNNLAVINEFNWIFDSSLNRLTKSVYAPTGSVKSHFGEFTNLSCEYITIKNIESLKNSMLSSIDSDIQESFTELKNYIDYVINSSNASAFINSSNWVLEHNFLINRFKDEALGNLENNGYMHDGNAILYAYEPDTYGQMNFVTVTDKLDELSLNINKAYDYIDTVVDNMNIDNSSLLKAISDISDISTQIGDIDSSIYELKEHDAITNSSILNITSSMSNINSSLSTINSSIYNINSSILSIRSSVSGINSTLININSSILTLNSSVSNIDSSVILINDSISIIDSSIEILEEKVNKINYIVYDGDIIIDYELGNTEYFEYDGNNGIAYIKIYPGVYTVLSPEFFNKIEADYSVSIIIFYLNNQNSSLHEFKFRVDYPDHILSDFRIGYYDSTVISDYGFIRNEYIGGELVYIVSDLEDIWNIEHLLDNLPGHIYEFDIIDGFVSQKCFLRP